MLKQIRQFFLQEIPVAGRPARLLDLDAARGLAIILVVIGHIVSQGSAPAGNDWFIVLMQLIYQFHMPFFMVLSGITFALSLPAFGSWGQVGAYSLKRVMPLMVPFIIMGLLVLVGKLVAMNYVPVSNPPGSFLDSAAMILLVPNESVARFLWFIYVLSIYLVLVPPLFYVLGRRPVPLLLVAAALQFFNWPDDLAVDWAVEYLPFFVLGMVLWIYRPSWAPVARRVFWPGTVVFVGLLALSHYQSVPRWLTGAASTLPLLGLAQWTSGKFQMFLGYLGQKSLSIYLFNVPVLGLVKGVCLHVLSWDGIFFFFYFPLLTVAGVGVPLAIKAAGQKWLPRAAKYI